MIVRIDKEFNPASYDLDVPCLNCEHRGGQHYTIDYRARKERDRINAPGDCGECRGSVGCIQFVPDIQEVKEILEARRISALPILEDYIDEYLQGITS